MSKIKLKRKEIIRYGLPKELRDEKVCNLGGYNDRNGVARPLTYAEEDKWMPEIVGLKVTDPGFRQAVTNWYKSLTLKVKPEGLEFEIGVDEAGNPYNVEDYVKYLFAKGHPWMAKSREECLGVEHLQFWFEDPEADNKVKSAKLEVSTKAYVEFAKLDDEEEKLDWVLRAVLGKFPEIGALSELVKLKVKDKKLKVAYIIQKDPEYFLEVMSDKDLIYKAELASMVDAGVITKEGNKYLNGTENLGSLDSAIAWMKDGNNSAEYAILKARLDQFGTPVTIKVKKEKTK